MSGAYANPYTAPRAADPYEPRIDAPEDQSVVPDGIVEQLRGTRPWVLFLAVMGFVGAGLMVLLGLFTFAAGSLGSGRDKLPGAIGLVYVVLAALYVWPSLYLLRYGSAITRLVRDPHMERLGVALGHQRAFWKLLGIMTVVVMALYGIGMVVGVAILVGREIH
jgi:hypothetical protein